MNVLYVFYIIVVLAASSDGEPSKQLQIQNITEAL
jgi:hypothetical protein